MIISRTPYRVSFFGGGTDYSVWYREHGGAVLATSIDKYCFLMCRYLPPFFSHRHRIVYSTIELPNAVDDIAHPSVRECLRHCGIHTGIEVQHHGDLPARSGVGSSSAFTVGLLHALYALKGVMPTRERLAREAMIVEQERIGETVGRQDQMMTALGGFRRLEFRQDDSIVSIPIIAPPRRLVELQGHLMLMYTGVSRSASEIASEQVRTVADRTSQLRSIHQLVDDATNVLTSGQDIVEFGRLLHEGWQLKRSLTSRITTDIIDGLYADARDAGAIGGKLLGAGGGGFFLLFVRPDDQANVRKKLARFVHVPMSFTSEGSQIIYYQEPPEIDERYLIDAAQPAHGVPS